MQAKFKLISSNSIDSFEERLNRFAASLDADNIIVDVKFSSAAVGQGVEYSALLHYQQTETWMAEE